MYNEVYAGIDQLDTALNELAIKLAGYHPDALKGLKQILWEGNENWDQLLSQRAAISGALVLSNFTQQALLSFLGGKR